MKTKRAKGMGKGCEEHQENKFCLKMTKQKKTKQNDEDKKRTERDWYMNRCPTHTYSLSWGTLQH